MNKRNLMIDVVILILFLISSVPKLFGESLHEWLGVAWMVTIIVHLLFHWQWITSVGAQFFRKLWHVSRLKFFVDVMLFISFIFVCLSGLVISKTVMPFFGIEIESASMLWRQLHKLSADVSVLLVGLHFALNWNWFVSMIKKSVLHPIGNLIRAKKPVEVPVLIENRK